MWFWSKNSHLKQHIAENKRIWKQSPSLWFSRSHQTYSPRGSSFYFKEDPIPQSSIATFKGHLQKWSRNGNFFTWKDPSEDLSKMKAAIHTGNHTNSLLFHGFLQFSHDLIYELSVRTFLNSVVRLTKKISLCQFNSKAKCRESACSSGNSELSSKRF